MSSPKKEYGNHQSVKEIKSPVKEHNSYKKDEHNSYKKDEHNSYKKDEHNSYKKDEHNIYKKEEQPIYKTEKHLKDLIEDKEPISKNKFDDVVQVQSTSFHIPTKQPERKEVVTSTTNSGFTIGTSSTLKYGQTPQPKTQTSAPIKKKEEPQQPMQMPYYPMPYPMFFCPPGYDPNNQSSNINMPTMSPQPMFYYMPPYMQPEKSDSDIKQNFNTFGTPTVRLPLFRKPKYQACTHILHSTIITPR
jgi:hypothetical protein